MYIHILILTYTIPYRPKTSRVTLQQPRKVAALVAGVAPSGAPNTHRAGRWPTFGNDAFSNWMLLSYGTLLELNRATTHIHTHTHTLSHAWLLSMTEVIPWVSKLVSLLQSHLCTHLPAALARAQGKVTNPAQVRFHPNNYHPVFIGQDW